jgi:drug/metabolite transporter (DMT)-like permease
VRNYLTPTFALVYGVVLLVERITLPAIFGLALIIGGAEITLRGDSTKRAGGKAKAHEYRARPPLH